jgi:hypothetical protein
MVSLSQLQIDFNGQQSQLLCCGMLLTYCASPTDKMRLACCRMYHFYLLAALLPTLHTHLQHLRCPTQCSPNITLRQPYNVNQHNLNQHKYTLRPFQSLKLTCSALRCPTMCCTRASRGARTCASRGTPPKQTWDRTRP